MFTATKKATLSSILSATRKASVNFPWAYCGELSWIIGNEGETLLKAEIKPVHAKDHLVYRVSRVEQIYKVIGI